ncbi:unnamed protein product [Chrysoparadoxa australica]
MSVHKVSSNVYIVDLEGKETKVTFGSNDASYSDGKAYSTGSGKHVAWGEKDGILNELHHLASESPNKWSMMKIRRNIIIGKGLEVLTKKKENGEYVFSLEDDEETRAIEEFLINMRYHKLTRVKAMDYCFSGRYFIKVVLGLDLKVTSLERIDPFYCRPAKLKEGEINISKYVLNGNFGTKRFRESENTYLPAFDYSNPTKYAVSILDVKDEWTGQKYNTFSEWWGTKDWTKVSNKIPKFHDSGLDNGYNIKYHISYPDDYFKDPNDDDPDGKKEASRKKKVLDQIEDTLKGVENNNKIIYTLSKVLLEGRAIESGVKITPLENKMNDDAYTQLFNTSNTAQGQGHLLQPTLAGIASGNKLGGSGKELEAAANFQQAFMTPSDRELMVEDLEAIRGIMGWSSEKVFMFKDVKLYTYDVTPSNADTNPNQELNQGEAKI